MKAREKNFESLMELPYKIEIRPIPEADGGGFTASLPELGKYAVCGDGETIDEALRSLEEVKKERFQAYLEAGVDIPEPEPDEDQVQREICRKITQVPPQGLVPQSEAEPRESQSLRFLSAFDRASERQDCVRG